MPNDENPLPVIKWRRFNSLDTGTHLTNNLDQPGQDSEYKPNQTLDQYSLIQFSEEVTEAYARRLFGRGTIEVHKTLSSLSTLIPLTPKSKPTLKERLIKKAESLVTKLMQALHDQLIKTDGVYCTCDCE